MISDVRTTDRSSKKIKTTDVCGTEGHFIIYIFRLSYIDGDSGQLMSRMSQMKNPPWARGGAGKYYENTSMQYTKIFFKL